MMPDLLMPVEKQNGKVLFHSGITTVWVQLDIPKDIPCGDYYVKVSISGRHSELNNAESVEANLKVNVLDELLPKPSC